MDKKRKSATATNLRNFYYRRAPEAVYRQAEKDEILVVDLSKPDQFFRINKWAAFLWMGLDGKSSLEEICDQIHRKSGYDLEFVQKYSLALIKDLKKSGLIKEI